VWLERHDKKSWVCKKIHNWQNLGVLLGNEKNKLNFVGSDEILLGLGSKKSKKL
jgi:hypothetical protein